MSGWTTNAHLPNFRNSTAGDDPTLMRGMGKLGALARAMRPRGSAGVIWGHLQQLELAGQGGFGEVYRAYDPTLPAMPAT